MKLEIRPMTMPNSKGITHSVYDEKNHIVGSGREADVVAFATETARLSRMPIVGTATQYGKSNPFYCFEFRVRRIIIATSGTLACYEILTLGYSPSGKPLTASGEDTFVNQHSSCLTAHYEAPKALPLVGDDMIVRTDYGNFQITQDRFGQYSAKRL